MSNSLADQLLKAGLVDEQQVNNAQQSKRRSQSNANQGKKQGSKNAGSAKSRAPSHARTQSSGQSANKLSDKQAKVEQRRLLNVQLKGVFEHEGVESPEGDQKFHYPYQNKVRGIYVSKSQHEKLSQGALAVTLYKAKTKLIPVELIDEVLAVDAERFMYVVSAESSAMTDEGDFPVPDDLIW